MDNHTFDVVKMLHQKLDSVGRIEKYYLNDAKNMGSECGKMVQAILDDERRHLDMLRNDLKTHI